MLHSLNIELIHIYFCFNLLVFLLPLFLYHFFVVLDLSCGALPERVFSCPKIIEFVGKANKEQGFTISHHRRAMAEAVKEGLGFLHYT